jgi:hypothetical protein
VCTVFTALTAYAIHVHNLAVDFTSRCLKPLIVHTKHLTFVHRYIYHEQTYRSHTWSRTRRRCRHSVSQYAMPDISVHPITWPFSSRAFAPTHRIALLSRSQSTLDRTASTLQPSAEYKTFTADTSTISSLHTAWDEIHKAWRDSPVQVAIFNAPTAFKPGKFLDKTEDDFKNTLHGGVYVDSRFYSLD